MSDGHAVPVAAAPRSYNQSGTEAATAGGGAVAGAGAATAGISGNGGGIAHLAHVGGAIVGFILAMIWKKHLYRFK